MIGIYETLKIAIQSLGINPLRSILTALGIVVGVASTVVLVAIGKGARTEIVDQIASVGSNLIIVVPGASQREGVYMGSGSVHSLTAADAEAIAKRCPSVKRVASVYGQVAQVISGNRNWRTRISGVSETYFNLRGWKIRHGRTFSPNEENSLAKVCVLGGKVQAALGGDMCPIGMTVRIQGVPFLVVGTLENKGQSYSGEDQDDVVFVPIKTAQARLFGTPFLGEVRIIIIQVSDPSMVHNAIAEINSLLLNRHKIGAGKDRDFTVRSLTESQNATQRSIEVMSIFLAAIAGISLVVGSIGIMNIMLVSVNERIREIGIRMAVGAKPIDIVLQFLTEAICLSIAGGLVGTVIGIVVSYTLTHNFGLPAILGLGEIATTLAISALVGVVSGFLPAWKASRLHPVDALRTE